MILTLTIRDGLHTFVAADKIQGGNLSGFVDRGVVHVVVVHVDLDVESELHGAVRAVQRAGAILYPGSDNKQEKKNRDQI